MLLTRRDWFTASALAVSGILTHAAEPKSVRPKMGIVVHSYGLRRSSLKDQPSADDPLTFIDYCRSIGAGGVQLGLGVRQEPWIDKLREYTARHKLYLEASIALPKDAGDIDRFAAEVRTAKACGVRVFRTVFMNGRRYEVFDSTGKFRQFHAQARSALNLARPVVEKLEVRMAVENHKDLRAVELAELIGKTASPWIGICLDTGNNIALLESPAETVEMLAPFTFTTHIKDMGLEEYPDGFLLSEVPLGTGYLDLPKIIGSIRRKLPDITLNLEMITRDPLKIPCLTEKYWSTLETLPGTSLARALLQVRQTPFNPKIPRISTLPKEEQVRREDQNVRDCLKWASDHSDA